METKWIQNFQALELSSFILTFQISLQSINAI